MPPDRRYSGKPVRVKVGKTIATGRRRRSLFLFATYEIAKFYQGGNHSSGWRDRGEDPRRVLPNTAYKYSGRGRNGDLPDGISSVLPAAHGIGDGDPVRACPPRFGGGGERRSGKEPCRPAEILAFVFGDRIRRQCFNVSSCALDEYGAKRNFGNFCLSDFGSRGVSCLRAFLFSRLVSGEKQFLAHGTLRDL